MKQVMYGMLLGIVAFFLYVSLLYSFEYLSTTMFFQPLPSISKTELEQTSNQYTKVPESVLFVGDVMLGRHVERLMYTHGPSYPYSHISSLFASSSFVVANFEAPIPPVHTPTPSGMFQFSVDTQWLPTFASSGVTHVSLANNHTSDHGAAGYKNTVAELEKVGIQSFGHATQLSSSSYTYTEVNDLVVSFIGIHTLFVVPDRAELKAHIQAMTQASDIQIAYVHWGDEYELIHNSAQEQLATFMASLGIDAVIGHHPHVTQDIQIIDGMPVFYSLGNFIFDQYFSNDVQQGYVLEMVPLTTSLEFSLVPITSIASRTQPQPMKGEELSTFLQALATRSDSTIADNIKQGKLIFDIRLAKS